MDFIGIKSGKFNMSIVRVKVYLGNGMVSKLLGKRIELPNTNEMVSRTVFFNYD